MGTKSNKKKNQRQVWGTGVPPQGQPKRRSESVLFTSSTDSMEQGDGESTSPETLLHQISIILNFWGPPLTRTPSSILTLFLGRLVWEFLLLAPLLALLP
ncbi:hypothetical protein Pcinc_032731 [Petrolisthes cinctipes]|uniref:Uncharacterized protein n=1 Tax=Petrolisthes cinctipes TaxID=88211 RepID=A0AAE1ETS1_PETCI|nr:hypothetical protein Pcinc_032731 [Petrolisthes cinctipes]